MNWVASWFLTAKKDVMRERKTWVAAWVASSLGNHGRDNRIEVEPDSLDVVVRGPAAVLTEIRESRTRLYLDVSMLPEGDHPYITEVVEGNLIHFFPRQPTVDLAPADSAGEGPLPSPELEGEVQNLPELVELVGSSPKVITIRRRGR